MGNSSGRETRSGGDRRSGESASRSPPSSGFSFGLGSGPSDGSGRLYSSRGGRSSRNDLNPFGPGNGPSDREADPHGPRRETRQEREARKLEKERKLRAQERERSLKEEGTDGGYLVTLGTYVGPEDFSKPMVRRLQIERRLAPFWRGLNEHSSEWTEHQLVAAAHGLPIPAPDEIPVEDDSPAMEETGTAGKPAIIQANSSNTPIGTAGQAQPHTPAFGAIAASPSHASSTSSSLFLGRAKGLASLSPPRDGPLQEMARQEVQLPREPHINGQPIEAYLYKDPGECPICFLYYPPFLNRTRCCDQPICSECFVQIKRPDPHQPEHTDPNSPAPDVAQVRPGEEEQQLVSEPATCPFCVMPEFGITYDPPPFRRGIMYADQPVPNSPIPPGQNSQPKRRRGQSVSATAPEVITTDMVRPDWAKRLADARAHAARRSAAATALHTAAYMMSSQGGSSLSGLGRRRRANDSGGSRELMHPMQMQHLMAVLEGQSSSRSPGSGGQDLFPARNSSRAGNQPEDLEELMMMEAIRQSLQAEEERKRKEDKDAAKAAKKEEKQRAKEAKKAEKAAKKNGGSYTSSRNNSQFFASSNNLALDPPPRTPQAASLDADKGKGKAHGEEKPRMTGIGFNPLDEPTSVVGNAHASNGLAESSVGARPSVQLVQQPDVDEAEDSSGSSSRPLQQDFNFGSLAEMIDKGNPEEAEEVEPSKTIET